MSETTEKTKQSYTVMRTTKKNPKKPRTWVITYRLVDGPPVDLEKVEAAKKRRKAKEEEAKPA